jgi:hypothetical protein
MIENQTADRPETADRPVGQGREPRSTAELIAQRDPGQPASNGQAVERNPNSYPALFPQNESEDFRSRWHDIQGRFVDEPRQAVEEADQLVAAVTSRIAEVFTKERATLEREWSAGQDVSTEDLRQALRRYRSFFQRLLSM